MNLRFCDRCASEVEDVGGFCLLGHPLRLEPLIPSVAQIRDQVTRAFDEARLEAGADPSPETSSEEPAAVTATLTPATPTPSTELEVAEVDALAEISSPSGAPESPTEVTFNPSPPPPPGRPVGGVHTVWQTLGDDSPEAGDPISAFAPPPRMDWGPERPSRFSRPLKRKERPATA